jgi:hypothetical protein
MVKVTDENISMMRKIIADQNKETAETLEKNKKKKEKERLPIFNEASFLVRNLIQFERLYSKSGQG